MKNTNQYNKIQIDSLVIEIGRPCDPKCKSCLKEEAENKVLDLNIAKNLLKECDVCALTITGGDAALYQNEIIELIDFILTEDIELGSFYIGTNSSIKTPYLMTKLKAIYAHCYDQSCGQNFFSDSKEADKSLGFNFSFDEEFFEVDMVYLNVEGCLLPDCDYSYDTQREMKPFEYGSMPLADIIKNYNKDAKAS